jgi:hypothetical protein
MIRTIPTDFKNFFIARTHARISRSTITFALCLAFLSISSFADDPQFIFGADSRIHGITLDRSAEASTRQAMQIANDCRWIKKQATAMALAGSENSSVNPRIASTRGAVVLESLRPGVGPKVLDTELLVPYKNYPTSIPGETAIQPSLRYPLAITLAAMLAGEGDLAVKNGDSLVIHTDGQLFSYSLPEITIPSGGLLRLYLGADDTLYYDAALTHPVHAGTCAPEGRAHGR